MATRLERNAALIRQRWAVTKVYASGVSGVEQMAEVLGPNGKVGMAAKLRVSIPIGAHKRVIF